MYHLYTVLCGVEVRALDCRSQHSELEPPKTFKILFLIYVAKNESLTLENDFDIENHVGKLIILNFMIFLTLFTLSLINLAMFLG